MTNDKILTQFMQKPSGNRKKMWFAAMRVSRTGSTASAREAARMLNEYEAIELAGDRPKATEPVGALMFEPHGHGFVSFGYTQGGMVVAIRKIEQHQHAGNRVYQVDVLGQTLPEACRSIEDARVCGAFEYAKRCGDTT